MAVGAAVVVAVGAAVAAVVAVAAVTAEEEGEEEEEEEEAAEGGGREAGLRPRKVDSILCAVQYSKVHGIIYIISLKKRAPHFNLITVQYSTPQQESTCLTPRSVPERSGGRLLASEVRNQV